MVRSVLMLFMCEYLAETSTEVPFLPVRDDFHPKRNQARQKLATLPKMRFKDLSGDVFYELGRRYPEFKEPEVSHSFLVVVNFSLHVMLLVGCR